MYFVRYNNTEKQSFNFANSLFLMIIEASKSPEKHSTIRLIGTYVCMYIFYLEVN